MRVRNLFIVALGVTVLNLFLRCTMWRHEYIREIVGHVTDVLDFRERELLSRCDRRDTRVNLRASFENLRKCYGTNLSQLRYDLGDTVLLLKCWVSDDPDGSEAYSECIDFLSGLGDRLDDLDPNPSPALLFRPVSKISRGRDNSIETILDGDGYLQMLFG